MDGSPFVIRSFVRPWPRWYLLDWIPSSWWWLASELILVVRSVIASNATSNEILISGLRIIISKIYPHRVKPELETARNKWFQSHWLTVSWTSTNVFNFLAPELKLLLLLKRRGGSTCLNRYWCCNSVALQFAFWISDIHASESCAHFSRLFMPEGSSSWQIYVCWLG